MRLGKLFSHTRDKAAVHEANVCGEQLCRQRSCTTRPCTQCHYRVDTKLRCSSDSCCILQSFLCSLTLRTAENADGRYSASLASEPFLVSARLGAQMTVQAALLARTTSHQRWLGARYPFQGCSCACQLRSASCSVTALHTPRSSPCAVQQQGAWNPRTCAQSPPFKPGQPPGNHLCPIILRSVTVL